MSSFFGTGTTTTTSAFTIKGHIEKNKVTYNVTIYIFIFKLTRDPYFFYFALFFNNMVSIVTQVKCDSKMKAPHNCLQYFTAASGRYSY